MLYNNLAAGKEGLKHHGLSFIRIYDITWAAGEINTQPQVEKYVATLAEMLKGYNSVNPLSPEEIQSVYYVLCATYFRNCAYFTEDMNGVDDLLARSKRALVFLADNREMFCGLL